MNLLDFLIALAESDGEITKNDKKKRGMV